jgi:hypothetical protein
MAFDGVDFTAMCRLIVTFFQAAQLTEINCAPINKSKPAATALR